MKTRIFRLLVCLVLVCVILVNCSPIRAEAVAASAFALVSGLTVLGSCLIGLGLAAGDNQEAFYEVCTMIAQHPKILPYFDTDGNIKIPRFGLDNGELSPWMIPAVLLQAIRGVLGELEILSDNGGPLNTEMEQYIDDPAYYGGYVLPRITPSESCPYFIVFSNGTDFWMKYYTGPLVGESYNDGSFYFYCPSETGAVSYYRYILSGSSTYYWKFSSQGSGDYDSWVDKFDPSSVIASNFEILDYDGSVVVPICGLSDSLISTDYDLTLFDVAPLDQELAQGYPDWALGQIQDEDDNYWYPLGLNQTLDQTLGLTQEQVQKGEGNFEQTQDQEQTQTQIPGLIQGFQDKVTTWFARLSLNVSNIFDTLVSIPQQLLTGIQNLFLPDAQMMYQQQVKWTTLLSDRFGAVYDSVALIDNIAGAFTLSATQTQIRFPLITIPFGDVNWEFGGWMVDVVPDGFEVLVDALKLGIDVLCTLAFVNAMKHRLDRVLEGRG